MGSIPQDAAESVQGRGELFPLEGRHRYGIAGGFFGGFARPSSAPKP